ncbi:hypothetical protein NP233_g9233 [Leucocoprinus birnbaumii]|uniref:Uncharacterized protein n=1 Tax=Leucocoprinus birnbaumii TaxID=56174 RepID=A0AAD5VKR7_9AGAR|nr:hypothetical protein NP233_g9233 [Leucocoprinus birnbaumii]
MKASSGLPLHQDHFYSVLREYCQWTLTGFLTIVSLLYSRSGTFRRRHFAVEGLQVPETLAALPLADDYVWFSVVEELLILAQRSGSQSPDSHYPLVAEIRLCASLWVKPEDLVISHSTREIVDALQAIVDPLYLNGTRALCTCVLILAPTSDVWDDTRRSSMIVYHANFSGDSDLKRLRFRCYIQDRYIWALRRLPHAITPYY